MESLTFDQFVGHLRSALHHLYDPDQLRRSPLAPLFGVGGFDAAAALATHPDRCDRGVAAQPDGAAAVTRLAHL